MSNRTELIKIYLTLHCLAVNLGYGRLCRERHRVWQPFTRMTEGMMPLSRNDQGYGSPALE